MRGRRFPGLEILIGIAILTLLYVIIYPQYREIEEGNREIATKLNMYAVKVAVENYASYNRGAFPDSIEQFNKYLENGYINPYTQEPLDSSQIVLFSYEMHDDNKDNNPEGPNGRVRGQPGQIAYGTYIPLGDSVVREYGIVALVKDGSPLTISDAAGKELVFVLHE